MAYASIRFGRASAVAADGGGAVTQDLEPAVVAELTRVFSDLAAGHDVLPFLNGMHSAATMAFRPLPDDMLGLIVGSDDYLPIGAGTSPTWFSISSPEGEAEIIVYRAVSDEQFYVAVPARRDHGS